MDDSDSALTCFCGDFNEWSRQKRWYKYRNATKSRFFSRLDNTDNSRFLSNSKQMKCDILWNLLSLWRTSGPEAELTRRTGRSDVRPRCVCEDQTAGGGGRIQRPCRRCEVRLAHVRRTFRWIWSIFQRQTTLLMKWIVIIDNKKIDMGWISLALLSHQVKKYCKFKNTGIWISYMALFQRICIAKLGKSGTYWMWKCLKNCSILKNYGYGFC